jgi:polyvinyl alcohol dehydrogenase (cytochrome)
MSAASVSQLKLAFEIPAPGVTSTAAIYRGMIYWADWGGFVHATRLADHGSRWTFDGSAIGGGYVGSPMVTERVVYVANRNGRLHALDRDSGAVAWEAKLDAGPHTQIWSSPVVEERDAMLVVGISNRGTRDNANAVPETRLRTFRGAVVGIDATTGMLAWRLETSPEPSGAGVGVWSSAALDSERRLAFIGTGNNFYAPVSELSDSLLAIDYLSGTLIWKAQYTKGDAWTAQTALGGYNADVAAAPNLFMLGARAVVGVGDKSGRYYVHDRESGDLIWKQVLTPGGLDGGIIAPAAYQNDVIYVISNDGNVSVAFALRALDGEKLWRHELPAHTSGGPAVGNGVLYVGDMAGQLHALDARSGSELWAATFPQGIGGGISLGCGTLLTGYGYHHFESEAEPLMGGLRAFALTADASTLSPSPDCQLE